MVSATKIIETFTFNNFEFQKDAVGKITAVAVRRINLIVECSKRFPVVITTVDDAGDLAIQLTSISTIVLMPANFSGVATAKWVFKKDFDKLSREVVRSRFRNVSGIARWRSTSGCQHPTQFRMTHFAILCVVF